MEFCVSDSQGHKVAGGKTDNPYQVRNSLRRFHITQYYDEHNARTSDNLFVYCSLPLNDILRDKPIAPTPTPLLRCASILLIEVCKKYHLSPTHTRRRLRKHFGAAHRKYIFTATELPEILTIIGVTHA